MVNFQDRILQNPRLLKLKDPRTNEIINFEIQDYTEQEIVQQGTEITAQILNEAFLSVHPVGCYYLTSDIANPGDLFGGTWELTAKDRVLIGAGHNYTPGQTGGQYQISIQTKNLPPHTHPIPVLRGYTTSNGTHYHRGRYGRNGVSSGGKLTVRRINPEDDYAGEDTITNTDGGHSHDIQTNASTTGSTGSGTPIPIVPLYLACYIWHRTA